MFHPIITEIENNRLELICSCNVFLCKFSQAWAYDVIDKTDAMIANSKLTRII